MEQNKLDQIALNSLPEYVKFTYTNHAIKQAQIKSRDILGMLPDKIRRDKIFIARSWWDGNTLEKIEIRLDLSNSLDLVLIYLPQAKQVKTVYKTRRASR